MAWKIKYAWIPMHIRGHRIYKEKYFVRKVYRCQSDRNIDIKTAVEEKLRHPNSNPLLETKKFLAEDAL